jgi:hypothetical protein
MSKNNKSDDKQSKQDEKEKKRRRKRTWKLVSRWGTRGVLALIALIFIVLSFYWFPAELHYRITETYTFSSKKATAINLAVLLPSSGPYQTLSEPQISWPGTWDSKADGRLNVFTLSTQIKPGETASAVISYQAELFQGPTAWIGEPVQSMDLLPSESIQSDAAELADHAADLQVAYNDQATVRNIFVWTRGYLSHSMGVEADADHSALAAFTAAAADSTGFANLFAALNRAVDIPARMVTGRVIPELIPLIPLTRRADDLFTFQAWNEIFMQDEWQIVDVYRSGSFLAHNLLGWTDGRHLVYDEASNLAAVYQNLVTEAEDQDNWSAVGTKPVTFVAWSDSEAKALTITPKLTIRKTWDGRWMMLIALLLILFIITWIIREDHYGEKLKSKRKDRKK